MNVVESRTPPPNDSKVITTLLVDLRFPASSADTHWNFLARSKGARPQIMEAQKRTAIETPFAKTTPSVSSSWWWMSSTSSVDIVTNIAGLGTVSFRARNLSRARFLVVGVI